MIKSPFIVIKHFMSPMECETLLDSIGAAMPLYDENDNNLKTIIKRPVQQQRVWNKLEQYFDYIEKYYNVEIESLADVDIEWYPEAAKEEAPRCENSLYFGKAWRIVNDYDFTIIVFLKDYNDTRDFDEDFECYGGKLELTNHGFSINPQRGMAIIFPSNQYFIHRTQSPVFGDAFQLRTHVICEKKFQYNSKQYEGNHSIWFKDLT